MTSQTGNVANDTTQTGNAANDTTQTAGVPTRRDQVEVKDATQTTSVVNDTSQVGEKNTLIKSVLGRMFMGMLIACMIMIIILCVCAYMKVKDSDGKIKEGTYLFTENPLWSSVSVAGVVVLFGCYGAYEYYHP